MTRIVAIDTAAEFGSLALLEEGALVEEILLHSPDGFSHVLFPQLAALMERHGWRHDSVTAYAAGAGPGSFTGVRIALAAVKGLAETAGVGAAAISNLMAMASFGSQPVRAPLSDARRGEIYGALFDADLRPLHSETVAPFQVWRNALPEQAELLTFEPDIFGVPATVVPRALAAAIGRLAPSHLVDPVAIDANYVRRSDAELNWKDR